MSTSDRGRIARVVAACLFALGAAAAGGCSRDAVATVNRQAITTKDLDRRVAFFELAYGHKLTGGQYQTARGQVLDMMIDEEVVLQEARRRRLSPKAADVEEEYRRVRNYLKERAYGGSEARLREGLKLLGLDEQYLRDYVTRQLTGEMLFRQVTGGITLTEQDLRRLYDLNKDKFKEADRGLVWEIRADSQAAAEKALAELRAGADFAAVAAKYSSDPLAKKTGGFLGWVTLGGQNVLPELQDAIRKAKPGTITGPFQSHVAWHIIRVDQFNPGRQRTFEEVRDELRQQVLDSRRQAAFQKFVDELTRRARITRNE